MTDEISRRAYYLEEGPEVLGEIIDLVVKGGDYRAEALNVLHDAKRALARAARRAEDLPAEFERVEINQSRGPKLEFSGELLCDHEFETKGRDPLRVSMEVWQTKGGALVAVTYSAPADRQGHENCSATIVEPQDDAQAMRFAVMDHFGWDLSARSMVVKKLKWTLRQDVE